MKVILRYGQTIRPERLDKEVNRFFYVFEGFFLRLTLRDAARQTRAFDHPEAILAGVNQNLTAFVHTFSVSGELLEGMHRLTLAEVEDQAGRDAEVWLVRCHAPIAVDIDFQTGGPEAPIRDMFESDGSDHNAFEL